VSPWVSTIAFGGLVQGGRGIQFLFLVLGGFFLASYSGPIYSCLIELVSAGLRSTVVSVMTLLQNLLGFAIGGWQPASFRIGTASGDRCLSIPFILFYQFLAF
jgi:hypothetical protein